MSSLNLNPNRHQRRALNSNQQEPLAVSRREAGRMLGCSIDTIDRLVDAGKLKKIKIGLGRNGRVSIVWKSILEHVEQGSR